MGKTIYLFPADAMQVCCSDPEMRQLSCMRLIAKMPTLAAIAYKTAKGTDIILAMLATDLRLHLCMMLAGNMKCFARSNLTAVSFVASALFAKQNPGDMAAA